MSAWRYAAAVGLLFYVTWFGFVSNVFAATISPSNITSDTVWTASSSPYVLDGVTVEAGITLTIEPGVVVKIKNGGEFIINGTLIADGTETEPIYLTSHQDDSVGGDTNNDGSATGPLARDWRTIQFNSGSVGELNYATIRYAGYFNSIKKSLPAVYNNGGTINISNSSISDNYLFSIGQISGALELRDSEVSGNQYGVVVMSGDVVLENNEFSNVTTRAVYVNGSGSFELSNNNFINNNIAVDLTLAAGRGFVHGGNTASGTGLYGIVIRGSVTSPVTLTSGDIPYIITAVGGLHAAGIFSIVTDNNLKISSGGELTFEPSSIIKFSSNSSIIVDGKLTSLGTKEEPIYFTSIKDDEVGGDTNDDGSATTPGSSNWNRIQFNSGSVGNFDNAIIRYAGARVGTDLTQSGIYNNGGTITITNSELTNNNQNGILNNSGTATINNSTISDHIVYGVRNNATNQIDARNNYWGDSSGPYHSTLNPTGLGNDVSNNVLFEPWKTFVCKENCYSNVLFLPGIQASRLYLGDGEQVSDKLWEPSLIDGNDDVAALALDENGQSSADIRTLDIIDETIFPYAGSNIYKGFMGFLDGLVSEGTINNWTPFAYDWRYDVFDIVDNGTRYRDGSFEGVIKYPIEELENLAANSKSGKVTIVGHSNGGLLAKAIMLRLEEQGKADLVDQIIFIGTPHLGTPKAMATILHGYGQEKLGGLVIDDSVARDVIKNMPGVYGLLPTAAYIDDMEIPLVTFDDSETTSSFRNAYGFGITNINEYTNFLLGNEDPNNRSDVGFDSINEPIVVNSVMLNEVLAQHGIQLDNWVPPTGVVVQEIIGTGLLTVSGLEYREITEQICTGVTPVSCVTKKLLKPYARFTKYGDETVVSQSSSGGNGNKIYLDMEELRDNMIFSEYSHANLTEVAVIQEVITKLLINENVDGIEFISGSEPEFSGQYYIESVDSPVNLYATDEQGNVTGLVLENGQLILKKEIPGSDYLTFGSTKYLIIPADINRTTTLVGEAVGSYNLRISELGSNDEQTVIHEIKIASTSPQMVTKFRKDEDGYSIVYVDSDGDGTVDQEMTLDGEPILPPEPEVTYSTLKSTINDLNLKSIYKKILLVNVELAEYFSIKAETNQKLKVYEIKTLDAMIFTIKAYIKKRLISVDDGNNLIRLIEKLKNN